MPDSVVIGPLSHYGHVVSFRRDRVVEGIYNGVRTARMIINRPILGQTFIAGEFVRIWYPNQPKTCRKCGAEGHLAASCKSHCFNCEQPGHCLEDCPLSPLCRVYLANTHSTSHCPYVYYSSNILSVKVTASSYVQAAERGMQAEETRHQQAREEERERKERENERKEKERAERVHEEHKKLERREEGREREQKNEGTQRERT